MNINLLTAMEAMFASEFGIDNHVSDSKEPPKKCFKPDCEQPRTGNKLYCSAACCKLHKGKASGI